MTLLVAPLEALTDPLITDPERRVLLALFSFRGKNTNTVFPGVELIAERANLTDKTRVSKLTKSLAEKGWLTKKKRGFTGCNEYTLMVPERLEGESSNLDSAAKLGGEAKLARDTNSNLDSETNSNLDSAAKYKEQTIEQTIEQDFMSGAPAPDPQPDEPHVVALPTNRHGTVGETYAVTQGEYLEFCELYPAVDVTQQLNAMRAWALSNPTKRKTLSGMPRFINSWLAKEQNRGGSHANTGYRDHQNSGKPRSAVDRVRERARQAGH